MKGRVRHSLKKRKMAYVTHTLRYQRMWVETRDCDMSAQEKKRQDSAISRLSFTPNAKQSPRQNTYFQIHYKLQSNTRRTKPACCWVHTRIGALMGQVTIIVPSDHISTNPTPGQPPAVSPPSSASSSWSRWCGGRTRRTSSLLTMMAALSSGTRRAENKRNRQIHPMALIPAR